MIARGRVQNGVVVLPEGIHLSEGQEVSVLYPSVADASQHSILDIPPVNLGAVLRPLTSDDDLLGEIFGRFCIGK